METSSVLGLVTTSGFVGMLIGGLITHRLTLWRDKRKEYNEVVRPLKDKIYSAKDYCTLPVSLESDLKAARHYISSRTLRLLKEKYAEYDRLFDEAPRLSSWQNDIEIDDARQAAIVKVLEDMDKLLKLK
ncbi:hypothetical protein K08M3_39670 [Vibrio alginolyticus]|uniref:Uncharacterized protein n=1 Tax=Vibrio alginolyticus TaxID=663 RepID=A0A1W6UCJ2_VIBAL|nr:hypothetical protein [Vibrio alginolyticus]ARP00811.1 hypothetical protein K01M1_39820 [Vibrio alginolyticus]ARP05511.1 hypothetical protein K04M1_39750 [Vibrio alginolyticus]ARP10569.1 hypothetical protein K04M3_39770 [Vibrio alginolyticus]ARP15668.1 hypothetical protein K04M5_40030 [Vibrio alginolyticus]ARP20722.1 hypothetical protein K05K4_39980 [Vibrio alginolyticus]